MRKGMFGKLAVQNIRNNRSTYVPYMLTCIFCGHAVFDSKIYAFVHT